MATGRPAARLAVLAACAWLFGCSGSEPAGASADDKAAPAAAPLQAAADNPSAQAAPAAPAPAPAPSTAAPEPTAEPAAAPPAAAAKVGADSACAALCKHSTELKCREAANCEALCKQSMVDDLCSAQQRAATDCMLKQPTKNWECSESGVAALKDGVCEAEQESFVKCVMELQGG